MTDQTIKESQFRILTQLDEHTREFYATHCGSSLRAYGVIAAIDEAIKHRGALKNIRSDNTPEFIAYVVQDWLKDLEIETLYD